MIFIGPERTGSSIYFSGDLKYINFKILIKGSNILSELYALHPGFRTAKNVSKFEDVDFFTDKNYFKGLDWLFNYFLLTIVLKLI